MLFVNQSYIGLKKELTNLWINWTVEVGSFSYIKLLKNCGLDVTNLIMSESEIESRMCEILNPKDDFDIMGFAESLLQIDSNTKFHPNYFENIKPQKSTLLRFKSFFKKLYIQKDLDTKK